MKQSYYLITALLTLSGCYEATSTDKNYLPSTNTVKDAKVTQAHNPIPLNNLLTVSDAKKILGEQAHLTDSSSSIGGEVARYLCSFTANSKDEKSGKTGALYFLSENYSEVSAAQKKYSFIYNANKNHEGIKILNGIGDEAYFHSDGENFYFIMVRKGTKVFNMKVNKITGTTSLDEFNTIANKITAAL